MAARRRLAVISTALCAGGDLALKAGLDTAIRHERPAGVIVLCWALALALVTLVPSLPSRAAAVAAGIAAGGAVGNAFSATAWSGGVPEPLVVAFGDTAIAFNLADVFALAGTALLFGAAAVYVLRHPGSLREPL